MDNIQNFPPNESIQVDFLPDQNTIPVQEVIVDEPPPNYEAPPEYEDVIKVGMEYEIRRSKRRSRGHSKRRRSESRKLSIQRNPAHLDVEEEIISIVTTSGEASGISQYGNLGERMDCVGKSRYFYCLIYLKVS